MLDTNIPAIRRLIPGLRLWRSRLREKRDGATPGTPFHQFASDEHDECVTLLKGLLSLTGDPDESVPRGKAPK